MEENKDWSSIRSSIEGAVQDILSGNDIGIQAKELSDKAGVALKNAGSYVKQNYEVMRNTINSKIIETNRPRPKVYLNAKRTESVVRIFVGIPMQVIFLIAWLSVTTILSPMWNFAIWFVASMPLVAFLALGIGLTAPAMGRLSLLDKASKYYRIMNGKSYIDIADIAKMSNEIPGAVVKNLSKMIDQRIFPEGHLDAERKVFMLDDDIYREYMAIEEQRREQEKIAAATKIVESHESGSNLDSVIKEGRAYILSIKELHIGITSEPMSSKLSVLETLLSAIFDRVQKEPKELSHMDKLMRYYLPTTLKLIKTYLDFDSIISPDNEVKNTKKEIELTLDSINKAFAEFQNRLFKSQAFDASADAALLKVMLTKEGLVGGMEGENTGNKLS